jgi:hypothetical protein
MSDHWEFYPTRIDDRAAFIFYDHGLGETIDQLPLPNVLKIHVEFDDPSENGLPKQSEFERLSALEDAVGTRMSAAGGAYVGRVTTNGARHFHCFVTFDHDAARSLVEGLKRVSGYELTFDLEPDPQKASYWQELFPSPEEWRILQDMKVLEVLKEHGDDPSIERRIDHWLYFAEQADRDHCAEWAETNGYTIESKTGASEAGARFGLHIHHIGRTVFDEIVATTQLLLSKAGEFGGEYDGWETSVKTVT